MYQQVPDPSCDLMHSGFLTADFLFLSFCFCFWAGLLILYPSYHSFLLGCPAARNALPTAVLGLSCSPCLGVASFGLLLFYILYQVLGTSEILLHIGHIQTWSGFVSSPDPSLCHIKAAFASWHTGQHSPWPAKLGVRWNGSFKAWLTFFSNRNFDKLPNYVYMLKPIFIFLK